MKRLPIFLLLAIMPFQAAWAAAPACRGKGCDAGRHVAAGAIPSANPDLPLPKGAPHLRGELRRYA